MVDRLKLIPRIGKSLLFIVVMLFLICGIEFFLFSLSPGMGEQIQEYSRQGGLLQSYLSWFKNVIIHFDFGRKVSDGALVTHTLKYAVWFTTKLTMGALFFTLFFSITSALLNTLQPRKWYTRMYYSTLSVISGFHLIALGALAQKLFGLAEINRVSLLPILILALGNGSVSDAISYLTQSFERIFNSDYIKAAKARGGNLWINAGYEMGISILSLINSRFPYLIGGAFIIEYFYEIRGLGYWIITGIKGREVLYLLAITFIVAFAVLLLNQTIQFLHSLLDPRLKKEKLY